MEKKWFHTILLLFALGLVVPLALIGCGEAGSSNNVSNTENLILQLTADASALTRVVAEAQAESTKAAAAKTLIDATQTAMSIPAATSTPTLPPGPTNTPTPILPTNTPTPIPPTNTPTPIPPTATLTPDPRLFSDDFELGIKPEWGMSGNGFASVNGKLVVENGYLTSQVIGDHNWQNYKIKINGYRVRHQTTRILVRVQDKDNYISLQCRGVNASYDYNCNWHKVIAGEDQIIPGSHFKFNRWKWGWYVDLFEIEVEDNIYRTLFQGSKSNHQRTLSFVDETFHSGGFQLDINGSMSFEGVEVLVLP